MIEWLVLKGFSLAGRGRRDLRGQGWCSSYLRFDGSKTMSSER
jgi:hypothetical protein